jgi:hypothetical protein
MNIKPFSNSKGKLARQTAIGIATCSRCVLLVGSLAIVTANARPTITNGPMTQFAWEGRRVVLNLTAKGAVVFYCP